jgi:hypothetical protein
MASRPVAHRICQSLTILAAKLPRDAPTVQLLVQSYTIHYLAKGRRVISAAGEDGPVRP